jgi:hypothetical protein
MVKCSKLEVLGQIKIGLHIFSNLQKKFFLLPHINSKEGYLGRILNICPELKLKPVFKKSLNSKEGYLGRILNICPELKLKPVFKKSLNSKVKI